MEQLVEFSLFLKRLSLKRLSPTRLLVVLVMMAQVSMAYAASDCSSDLVDSPTKSELKIESARASGLNYIQDFPPGITRVKTGSGFSYFSPHGLPITEGVELARIKAIGIPPGHENVWISIDPNSHIQAMGTDSRGRKQYQYHPMWISLASELKFKKILEFGLALPGLRQKVAEDLASEGLGQDKVLAAIVRLLEISLIRVGSEEYASDNGSYGLTTMKKRHVTLDGSVIQFSFLGKSNVYHDTAIEDSQLAEVVRSLLLLPGDQLFSYTTPQGEHSVSAADVNAYIKHATNGSYSAKDFRTWMGTVYAVQTLLEAPRPKDKSESDSLLKSAIEVASEKLGNTPAVARKSYIHPIVFDLNLVDGELEAIKSQVEKAPHIRTLAEEVTLILIK